MNRMLRGWLRHGREWADFWEAVERCETTGYGYHFPELLLFVEPRLTAAAYLAEAPASAHQVEVRILVPAFDAQADRSGLFDQAIRLRISKIPPDVLERLQEVAGDDPAPPYRRTA